MQLLLVLIRFYFLEIQIKIIPEVNKVLIESVNNICFSCSQSLIRTLTNIEKWFSANLNHKSKSTAFISFLPNSQNDFQSISILIFRYLFCS